MSTTSPLGVTRGPTLCSSGGQGGLAGLNDAPRPGGKLVYGADFRHQVLALLEQAPPSGQAAWAGPAVTAKLNGSGQAVWRGLRTEGICLQRQRLYLNPPEHALVISVEAKPSIQALERATGYVETANSKIVRGCKSPDKRHGTLQRREGFLQFMDPVVAETPTRRALHRVLDHDCTHKKCAAWLAAPPNVHFHFTPTSASWLNQIEIWFGIMSRKALRGASFKNVTERRQAIEACIAAYNPNAKPFQWRKREGKGSQLRNTIINLRS